MSDRRRNQYAANCKVCGVEVQPGNGWLYNDTRCRAGQGKWSKFVKCDRCHELGVSHKSQLPENQTAPQPTVRPWSVSQVRLWTIERGEVDGDAALFVVGSFGREVISYRDRINSGFCVFSGYALEMHEVAGKPLSKAGVEELSPRLEAAADVIRGDEVEALDNAVAKLLAAGGTFDPLAQRQHYRRVEFRGGSWCVFANSVYGQPALGLPYINTTVEKLIGSEE